MYNQELNQILEDKIMQKNYPQRLEMQIPKENTYIGLANTPNIDAELEEFLNNHFEFPSNNIIDIKNFISEDQKLENIIYDLPNIISKEFPQCPIFIDFMKYTLPDEIVLQISIKTPFDGETSSAKNDLILDEILYKYESPEKHYFITMEF